MEALTADVEAVLADQTVTVTAHAAVERRKKMRVSVRERGAKVTSENERESARARRQDDH